MWLTIHDHDGPWPDVEETGDTYLENALLKAHAVSVALGEPSMADDSGIEVDALGGRPGPRSARFAGDTATDDENLRAMIQALAGVPTGGRTLATGASLPSHGRTAGRSTPKAPARAR